VTAWAVRGVELPFGDEAGLWWIDASGQVGGEPIPAADPLPGGYFLPGLIDAHAHPAVGAGPADLVALDASAARANLIAWAQAGVTVVRDVGSPAGVTLQLEPESGMPAVQAAGRFLAPEGRYFSDLLGNPVAEAELVSCALAEIDRGATWVKVIADFPNLVTGTETEATYRMEAIEQLVDAAHRAGAASVWPRRFLGTVTSADIVTYHQDPRDDPHPLAHPAAVVVRGTRLR
jgi:imidazolonepropionase-like amidohydrolase